MDEGRLKQKVQTVIVSCSVILMTGKFIAFFMTNSVGILTDAMETIVTWLPDSSVYTAFILRQNLKMKVTLSVMGK